MYYIIKTVRGNFYAEAEQELTTEEATRLVKRPVLDLKPISAFRFKMMTY